MSKSHESQKENKRKPQHSMKEKRALKKSKKENQQHGVMEALHNDK